MIGFVFFCLRSSKKEEKRNKQNMPKLIIFYNNKHSAKRKKANHQKMKNRIEKKLSRKLAFIIIIYPYQHDS
jgi:hypothetical protein